MYIREEADTRIILHAADAAQEGHRRIDDTDVLALVVVFAGIL